MGGFHFPNPGQIIHDIENAAHRAADGAVHGVQGAANNALHGIEGAANGAIHKIEGAGQSAIHGIEGTANKAVHEIEGKVGELPHLAEQAAKDAIQKLASVPGPHLIESMRDHIAGMRDDLDSFKQDQPDLVECFDDVGVGGNLSLLEVGYYGWYSRVEEMLSALGGFAAHFELRRGPVKSLLLATAPTTVKLAPSFELFSSAISAGVWLELPGKLIPVAVDKALERAGVAA